MKSFSKIVAGALIVAAASACGGGGSGASSVTAPPTGGTSGNNGGTVGTSCTTNTICMLFSATGSTYDGSSGTGSFAPATLTVARGATVTFANNSGVTHDVIFDGAAPTGGDIGVIASGSQTRTFSTAGTFPFHCAIHEGMVGTVTVQ